jgi:flavin reductase (DIM6/NTAB) family NADH-FMN oxidoreductase RutF
MRKIKQPAQLLLGPIPAALIACSDGKKDNIITLAWVGVVNSSPPYISAAIRANRYSHDIIKVSGEFTVNIPTVDQVEIVDVCGTRSGSDLDKFDHFSLTAVKGQLEKAPMINECPISMECRVEHTLELGSHSVYIGHVLATYVAEEIRDADGKIDFERFRMLGFCDGNYLETTPLKVRSGYSLIGEK